MPHPLRSAIAASPRGLALSACVAAALTAFVAAPLFAAEPAATPASAAKPRATATARAAASAASAGSPAATPTRTSGIDRSGIDPAVRAQDDLFRHVSGRWLRDTAIPADRAAVGAFPDLRESVVTQLRELVEAIGDQPADANARQVGDLYASFMDEPRLEALGVRPLASELAAIDAVGSPQELALLFARLDRLGVATPVGFGVDQDAKDATRYLPTLSQSNQGLPDRDYYLKEDDAKFRQAREQYLVYLAKLLTLAGTAMPASAAVAPSADDSARAVLALETALMRAQWTRVENRDPVKTYNRLDRAGLQQLAPGIAWGPVLDAAGFRDAAMPLVVRQPAYLGAVAALMQRVPLATWKAYARTHLLSAYAPFLGKAFVDARFAMLGTVLEGTTENRPRWQRGIAVLEESLGEGLGRIYVARHFPPANKARMEQLVATLLAAYEVSIDGLDWMGPETKKQAQAKLATFNPKIGYPNRWIDYASVTIARDDLVGNVMRARSAANGRRLDRLGKPVDRERWGMTPQTVNAYYNASLNEIVFPAAILQPPFFDANADDAVNYGGIGAVIGHEISHGFDDSGSQFDALGNLRVWWTDADRAQFKRKTEALVAQYAAFEALPGYFVNGELTLGENIGDNSGLAIAYQAYHASLGGRPAPVIDGMSGDERFFYGFAQVWQRKQREAATLKQVKSDPHSPAEFRANGTVRNHPAFYTTFGVAPGDRMYLAPAERVSIW